MNNFDTWVNNIDCQVRRSQGASLCKHLCCHPYPWFANVILQGAEISLWFTVHVLAISFLSLFSHMPYCYVRRCHDASLFKYLSCRFYVFFAHWHLVGCGDPKVLRCASICDLGLSLLPTAYCRVRRSQGASLCMYLKIDQTRQIVLRNIQIYFNFHIPLNFL